MVMVERRWGVFFSLCDADDDDALTVEWCMRVWRVCGKTEKGDTGFSHLENVGSGALCVRAERR